MIETHVKTATERKSPYFCCYLLTFPGCLSSDTVNCELLAVATFLRAEPSGLLPILRARVDMSLASVSGAFFLIQIPSCLCGCQSARLILVSESDAAIWEH